MTKRLRVLLVEDDADDAELLSMRLAAHGYTPVVGRVETVAALESALDEAWDVAVADHKLPGLTSLDALRIVRARRPTLPFVILSGQIGEDLAVDALKAGADDYVMKDRLGRLVPAVERAIAEWERRREESEVANALRVAQAHLRWLVESSPAVVYQLEACEERTLRFVSDNLTALLGRSPGAVVGLPGERWRPLHPEDAAAVHQAMAELGPGAPRRLVYRCQHADGTYRWVQDDVRFVPGGQGQPASFVGALVDVTEQRRLEQQMHRALRMETVGRLAGGLAHDFNNLLAVILGCGHEVLRGMSPDDPKFESAQAIRRAATRGKAVTARLLGFSRRQPARARVRDLNDIVRESEPLIRSLFRSNVLVEVRPAHTPQPVFIDDGQLEQVLLNLVINARDAMRGSGRLFVAVMSADAAPGPGEAGPRAAIVVSDSGTGIDPEVLPRIFEPFFTTKARGEGTGLGLSLVQSVVTESGGDIQVASRPGEGTTFTIRLPLACAGTEGVGDPPPAAEHARGRVLLVDDDDLVRDVISRNLLAAGHGVQVAATGHEALRAHEAGGVAVDLLVTDLSMPDIDGVELARRLASRQPDLKVLYVSGRSDEVLPENPPNEFLAKPFETDELLAAIDRLLGGTITQPSP